MTAEQKIIHDLKIEIKRLRLQNLKLRLHMDVILTHPAGTAFKKIADQYLKKPISNELLTCRDN